MNEKFNKNAKVEQLTKVVLSHGEEKNLIVKDPFESSIHLAHGIYLIVFVVTWNTDFFIRNIHTIWNEFIKNNQWMQSSL